MSLEKWTVEPISFKSARSFLQRWDNREANGLHVSHCFGLFHPNEFSPTMCGTIVYGKPAMSSQCTKWAPSAPDKLLELRRICFSSDADKFAEAFFLNKTLDWLRWNTDARVVIAYANNAEGDLYRAVNWKMVGVTSAGMLLTVDGESYHDRTLRMNKPYARHIRERFDSGDKGIKLVSTPPKHIFLYRLRTAHISE